ncbi:MAG: hypothetical protein LBK52_06845 [Deltaproteobacteria bacterium]|jgi:hypothetical protein|nr:hypothetical protein [Deltaproteobacteria bacterium]
MPYIYSGVCLAAMFGSILYEHHKMKKEEAQLCEQMRLLAEQTKSEFGQMPLPNHLENRSYQTFWPVH